MSAQLGLHGTQGRPWFRDPGAWLSIFLLLFCLWVRQFSHFVTQWLYLRTERIPVEDFQAHAYRVRFSVGCLEWFVSVDMDLAVL